MRIQEVSREETLGKSEDIREEDSPDSGAPEDAKIEAVTRGRRLRRYAT